MALETTTPRLLRSVPALDGLRGIAVLTVIGFHASVLMPSMEHRFLQDGGLGVDVFFVLSGFLITALLLREEALTGRIGIGRFYLRRALRLLPALVVLLGAHAVYASVARLPANVERSSLLSVFFYYSNTGLRELPVAEGLGHLWSLAVEEQFYVVWPVCVIVLLGLRRRTSTVVWTTVAAIAAVVAYRAVQFEQGTPVLHLYMRTSTRADSLLVGALLAQLWVRGRTPTQGLPAAAWPALALLAYAIANGVADGLLYRGGFTVIALLVAVIVLAVLESGWVVTRVFELAPLRAIGRVSYGLYIWHLAIFQAVKVEGAGLAPLTRLAVGIGLTAGAAWLSWTVVEKPFLRWKDRLEPARARAAVDDIDLPEVVAAGEPRGSEPAVRR